MSRLSSAELLAEVPEDLISKFRTQFHDNFKKEIGNGQFDQRDVSEMLSDIRIRCYLALAEHDIKVALKNTHEMFRWRQEFRVRDIKHSDFPPSFLRGSMHFRNKDVEGNNIFWFLVKYNKKGVDNALKKKIFAYMLEQHYQKFPGERITFVFDMTDCGLGQADLDVMRFMINCFQVNFPFVVNNLVVYKLPWILDGVWRIIKSWLPAKSQEKVKFVSGEGIDAYVDKANRPPHMGGGSDRFLDAHSDGDAIYLPFSGLYSGSPRTLGQHNASFSSVAPSIISDNASLVPPSECDTVTGGDNQDDSRSSSLATPPGSPKLEEAAEATGLDLAQQSTPLKASITPALASPPRIQRSVSSDAPLLEFSPDLQIIFEKTSNADLIEASIYLRNVSASIVAFKVKSTSMTRYRSRPCAGFIQPGHTRHVHISCRSCDRGYLSSDRFLIQYMQSSESSIDPSLPPATSASRVMSIKTPDTKIFEKRLIPAASHSLSPLSAGSIPNGDAGHKMQASSTPTPTMMLNSHDNPTQKVSFVNAALAPAALQSSPSAVDLDRLTEANEKLRLEVLSQRRYLKYLALLVTIQFMVFVFHIFAEEIHEFIGPHIGSLGSRSSCSAKPVNFPTKLSKEL